RAAFDLRYEVFCNEQGVPLELELDEHDADALHLVAVEEGEVVATCRLLRVGDTVKFGRLVVAQRARRRGIAADMLAETERRARELRARRLVLSAQTYAVKLYEDAGYVAFGDTYDDAGIEHISMERELA
ncbi:MAG: GNAT family N-acetyltransferase, partial [Baekduiaceae bacterium]